MVDAVSSTPLINRDKNPHQHLLDAVDFLAQSLCGMQMCLAVLMGNIVELLLRPYHEYISSTASIATLILLFAMFFSKATLYKAMYKHMASGYGTVADPAVDSIKQDMALVKHLFRYVGVRDLVALPLVIELLLRHSYPELALCAPIGALFVICAFFVTNLLRSKRSQPWTWRGHTGNGEKDFVKSIIRHAAILDIVFFPFVLFLYATLSCKVGFSNWGLWRLQKR